MNLIVKINIIQSKEKTIHANYIYDSGKTLSWSQIPNYEYIKIARVVKIVGKLSGFEVDLKIALLE